MSGALAQQHARECLSPSEVPESCSDPRRVLRQSQSNRWHTISRPDAHQLRLPCEVVCLTSHPFHALLLTVRKSRWGRKRFLTSDPRRHRALLPCEIEVEPSRPKDAKSTRWPTAGDWLEALPLGTPGVASPEKLLWRPRWGGLSTWWTRWPL